MLRTVIRSALLSNILFASLAQATPQPLSIPHTNQAIEIDAQLNDQAWQQALTVELNIVNSPWNNQPSPVKTTAKIIEDGKNLYIAFIADDPHPEQIRGFLADRDTTIADDVVGIKLDPFNDRRLNYQFFVNPYGVQNDRMENENTGNTNSAWDAIWQSYGIKTDKGYQVEMAIPFSELNFKSSDELKTWSLELIRLYPRDERLRISHIKLNRDNPCWTCQMPEVVGFKQAKSGKKLRITPYAVAQSEQNRAVTADNIEDWQRDNNTTAGIDLNWGITSNTTLTASYNPDFSTVESDAGQLNVNKNFALFYKEKRPFFLENSDYFASNNNLVYTRNIADPDYGIKLTGREANYSYGMFVTNDTQTNFIVPGNLSSGLKVLDQTSQNMAVNYRYNVNDDFSVGAISTFRSADNYHNLVAGIDTKYRFDDSNSLLAQWLYTDSKNPDSLLHYYDGKQNINDTAYKVNFVHDSEDWTVDVLHERINPEFRADLGFMPRNDYQQTALDIERTYYGDDNTLWSELHLSNNWAIKHNTNGELIERSISPKFVIKGPLLSYVSISYLHTDKASLRLNNNIKRIDNNSLRFNENRVNIYTEFQPNARWFYGVGGNIGTKIDNINNRLGDYHELYSYLTINATDHLLLDFSYETSRLSTDEGQVYRANLIDARISYQFDVRSYLKLNLVYQDVKRNPFNNPNMIVVSEKDKQLSTQLIYSYKINPQTVFFLGYSDSSFADDEIDSLTRNERTFFTKVSYAWMQ